MLERLNDVKEQLNCSEDYASLNRSMLRVEMLLRNSHFSEDIKEFYKEKIKLLDLDKMANQDAVMPVSHIMPQIFDKSKKDSIAIVDVLIEEETIVSQKPE